MNDRLIRTAKKLGAMENSNKLHFNFRKFQIKQGQEIFRSKRLLTVYLMLPGKIYQKITF